MINKHLVMQHWVQKFLDNNYMYFQSADAYPGVRVVEPEVGDYLMKTDITGAKYKAYTFVFVAYERLDLGTSSVNTDNMFLFDRFVEWLIQQKEDENFPDFGAECSEYDIIVLQNMAHIGAIVEDNLAKYMLGVRIEYKEE